MELDSSIVAAIITGLITFTGVLIANSKTQAVMSERLTHTNEKIGELSERVEKHNQVVERVFKLETTVAEESKTLFNEIRDHDTRIKAIEQCREVRT